jgi:two-component sensor histidine kinase
VPASLTIDDAIPCGLIVNELISNCFKHAFPGHSGGRIDVLFHPLEEEHFELVVQDNGIGLPEEVQAASPTSMGLTLVTNLVEQLGGDLTVERDHGTLFRLRFHRGE